MNQREKDFREMISNVDHPALVAKWPNRKEREAVIASAKKELRAMRARRPLIQKIAAGVRNACAIGPRKYERI